MHIIHQGGSMYRFMCDILKNTLVSAITNSVSITCNTQILFGKWKPFYLVIFNGFHEIRILLKTKFTSICLFFTLWIHHLTIRGGGNIFIPDTDLGFFIHKKSVCFCLDMEISSILNILLKVIVEICRVRLFIFCVSFRSRCVFYEIWRHTLKKVSKNIAPTPKIKPLIEK